MMGAAGGSCALGLLCVVITAIDGDEGRGEDVAATLADDSGEMSATLHAGPWRAPGCVLPGAAWAVKASAF